VDQSSNATSIEQVEAVTMEPILIYKVTNKANSKVYIGQTVKSLKRRWANHLSDSRKFNQHFKNAIRKYGRENFRVEVIDTANCPAMADLKEKLEIFKHDSTNQKRGYNMTFGGQGFAGTPDARRKQLAACSTPEYRKKMSAIKKIVQSNPEARKKMSEASKAVWADPERRKKMSEASKARWADPEKYRGFSAIQKMVQSTPEAGKEKSEIIKSLYSDAEYRKRHSAACKAACVTPEFRQKASAAAKSAWSSPEYRQRALATLKAAMCTPEAHKRLSEASKARWADPEYRKKWSRARLVTKTGTKDREEKAA
jgi:group I intron endonuclease